MCNLRPKHPASSCQ